MQGKAERLLRNFALRQHSRRDRDADRRGWANCGAEVVRIGYKLTRAGCKGPDAR